MKIHSPRRSAIPLGIAAGLAFLSGCDLKGDLAATGTGDVSNPAAPRVAFDAELNTACRSDATSTPSPSLARTPYLQQVTSESAQLMWTSTSSDPATVAVSLPDGMAVGEFVAEPDASVRELRGATQLVAHLEGLTPSTIYCYEIKDSAAQLMGRTGFRTAPPAQGKAPIRFVAIGDSGSGDGDAHAVLDQMKDLSFDLLLMLGDDAYESGTLAEFEGHVFDVYGSLLKSVPVFPSSGNHEYETDDAKPFREVFSLPENGGDLGKERWYSYDWGDVHFVVLDTERLSQQQTAWLDADLGATKLPWKIVYFHQPPYSSGAHGSNMAVRSAFSPIFEKYGVQLVLSGHDHDYERMKPQNGVTYVVSGGGGRGTKSVGKSDFTAFSEAVEHLVYVVIDGDQLTLHTIDAVGREFDSVVIPKGAAPAPVAHVAD